MQRYVLRADDGPFPDDRGDGASSATSGREAGASGDPPSTNRRGRRFGSPPSRPKTVRTMEATYVVTSSEQRRALPDLGDVAAGPARTCEELQRGMEPRRRAFPSAGRLRVTGTVGPMTRESANVAMTWVRSHAERLVGAAKFDDTTDVHVHLAEAARWKDGPSAGVTLAVALVSALTGQPVRGDAAMSGELTLAGTVEPVGGILEKVLGACRSRLAAVILAVGQRGRHRRKLRRRAAVRHQRALREYDERCARGSAHVLA